MKKEMLSKEKTYTCVLFFFMRSHGTGEARGQTRQRSNEVIIWMTLFVLFVASYYTLEQTFPQWTIFGNPGDCHKSEIEAKSARAESTNRGLNKLISARNP